MEIGTALAAVMKIPAKAWRYMLNLLWALLSPKKLERARKVLDASRHAERCPNCDERMTCIAAHGISQWRWRCHKCDRGFWIPVKE